MEYEKQEGTRRGFFAVDLTNREATFIEDRGGVFIVLDGNLVVAKAEYIEKLTGFTLILNCK